jgi:hypothetical protein
MNEAARYAYGARLPATAQAQVGMRGSTPLLDKVSNDACKLLTQRNSLLGLLPNRPTGSGCLVPKLEQKDLIGIPPPEG